MSAPLYAVIGDFIGTIQDHGIAKPDPRTAEPRLEQASPWDIAEAILAMPEMQALHAWACEMAGLVENEWGGDPISELPEPVRDWLQS